MVEAGAPHGKRFLGSLQPEAAGFPLPDEGSVQPQDEKPKGLVC